MNGEGDVEVIESRPWTHMLTLNVGTGNTGQWTSVYQTFCEISAEMGRIYPYVSVSSTQVGPDNDEDEEGGYVAGETLQRVRDVLEACINVSAGDDVSTIIDRLMDNDVLKRSK